MRGIGWRNTSRFFKSAPAAFDEPGVDTFWGPFLENVYTETAAAVIASGFEFNDTLSAATSYSYRAYFQAVFTDAQTELVACWKAIADARVAGFIDDIELEALADAMGAMLTVAGVNATYGFTGGLFDIAKATELNAAMKDDESSLGKF